MVFTSLDPSLTPTASIGYQNIPNILDNGGFEIWQRGITFTNPVSGVYTADRWQCGKSVGVTVNITQDASIFDSGTFSIKVDTTVASGSSMYVIQAIENWQPYKGKTISYSCRIKTSTANKIRLAIADGVTQTFSNYHSGSGNFETLTMTFNVSTSATGISCYVGMVADTVVVNTFWADAAMLVAGSTAVAFVPGNPQQDLARCQRYYFVIGGLQINEWIATGQVVSANESQAPYRFPVTMRIAPTMAVTSPTSFFVRTASADIVTTAINFISTSTQGTLLRFTVAGGLTNNNAGILLTNSTTATITASADL
jgi:hypothetical protein